MPVPTILEVLVVFFVAGTVKGVTGLGLPTVSLALLTLFLPLPQAVALMILPSFATNVWQAAAGGNFRLLVARLWPLLLCICIGVGITAVASWSGSAWAGAMLGAVLCVYAILGLAAIRFRVSKAAQPLLSPTVGILTGLLTGITGSFVIPLVPYPQALDLDKDAFVQAMGLAFTVSTFALAVTLTHTSVVNAETAIVSAAALAPAFFGMHAGQKLRTLISQQRFRQSVFAVLLVLGADLVRRAMY